MKKNKKIEVRKCGECGKKAITKEQVKDLDSFGMCIVCDKIKHNVSGK